MFDYGSSHTTIFPAATPYPSGFPAVAVFAALAVLCLARAATAGALRPLHPRVRGIIPPTPLPLGRCPKPRQGGLCRPPLQPPRHVNFKTNQPSVDPPLPISAVSWCWRKRQPNLGNHSLIRICHTYCVRCACGPSTTALWNILTVSRSIRANVPPCLRAAARDPLYPRVASMKSTPDGPPPFQQGGCGPYRPFGMLNHDLGHTEKRGVPYITVSQG